MRSEQAAALDEKAVAVIAESPLAGELMRKLLRRGGRHVVLQRDLDIDAILDRGRFKSGAGARAFPGERSDCHGNAARLWLDDQDSLRIVTGYALTADDGLWRQHTWVTEGGGIIETTSPRSDYYGYELDRARALLFATEND